MGTVNFMLSLQKVNELLKQWRDKLDSYENLSDQLVERLRTKNILEEEHSNLSSSNLKRWLSG